MEVKEPRPKRNKNIFKVKDLQTYISGFYILLVGIGMVFEYFKYELFDINIFEYANIFDFLIAPFRDPVIFIFVFVSVALIYVVYIFDTWFKNKFGRVYSVLALRLDKRSWFESIRRLLAIGLGGIYIFMSAQIRGAENKKRMERREEKIEIVFSDNDIIKGVEIGKTDEVIFLKNGDLISVIPYKSIVKKIRIQKK